MTRRRTIQNSESRVQNPERERSQSRKLSAVSGRLVVRPMTMADKAAALGISARIWEGNDYVPLFFDRWVREGGFWAGELRGQVIGFGKATELAPGEVWLEGLRVDPDCRQRGIGKEMSRQVLQRTLDTRPVSLRLATADVNHESIHIIETVMHFRLYAKYRFFVGRPGKPSPGPRLATPTVAAAIGYVERSAELAASRGLLQYTWLFRHIDRRYMAELVRGGYVFGFGRAGGLAGLLVTRPHRYHGNDIDISFVAGNRAALAAFRSFLSRVAHDCGTKSISGMAASDEMAAALESLGLKPHAEIAAVPVYEYPI